MRSSRISGADAAAPPDMSTSAYALNSEPHIKTSTPILASPGNWNHVTYTHARDVGLAIAGWAQEYTQVSPGRFLADVEVVNLGDLEVMRERSNQALLKSGTCWTGSVVFSFPLRLSRPAIVAGHVLDAGQALACIGQQFPELMIDGGCDIASLTFSSAWMRDRVAGLDARNEVSRLLGEGRMVLPAESLGRLREGILNIFESARRDAGMYLRPELLAKAQQELAAGLAEALNFRKNSSIGNRNPHLEIANAARRFALADTSRPIDIEELCRSLGVSRRHLQNCFQRSYGMSAKRLLRAVRLNKARDDLQNFQFDSKPISIGDVAAQWGFWHGSRFAQEYREFFDELPSQTIKKQNDIE